MSDLYAGLLRGRGKPEIGKQALEYFAPTERIREEPSLRFDPANPDGKLFLGLIDATIQGKAARDRHARGGRPIGIRPEVHITTIAGSQSGKSRAAILPNLLHFPGSMLVIDPKGDLACQTAVWRHEGLGQSVYALDPYRATGQVGEGFAACLNPLAILRADSPTLLDDASVIADSLIIPQGKDPHWDESARAFLEAICIHVATSPLAKYEGKRDLISVQQVLQHDVLKRLEAEFEDEDDRFVLQNEMENNPAADGAVVAGANTFYERGLGERSAVLSTLRRHVHFLSYAGMKTVLRGERSIDLRQLKREPTTIYLSLPASRMGPCKGWLRLIVNLLLTAMEEERTKPEHPVIAVLDEFHVLGTMERISQAAGLLAGLDLILWVVLQDLGQLKAAYKDNWETFLGNSGIVQCYGNSDITTLEWIEKRLGKTTVLAPSTSDPNFLAEAERGDTGRSWSQALHPLMSTSEIASIFGRSDPLLRQLIIRPQYRPMILQRAFIDKHELFEGRRSER